MSTSSINFSNQYDIETFLVDLESVLKTNLNTYIDQMNSDKDGPDLEDIDERAYYIQTLDDAVVNYDDFVFIFEDSVATESMGAENAESYTVVVCIVSNTKNEPTRHTFKRAFRYREILKRIFQNKRTFLNRPGEVKISSLSPFAVSLLNQSAPQMGIGVSLEVSFA